MSYDDDEMPDGLRSVIDALRDAPPPDAEADARLRGQVGAMVRSMVTVLPDPVATQGPPNPPRFPWQRAIPIATFGLGLGLGALLHALLAEPTVRIVVREIEHPLTASAPREVPPIQPTLALPSGAVVPVLETHGRDGGTDDDGVDDVRLRAQLVRVEQFLDSGDAETALRRLRSLERARVRSPALDGFREALAVRAMRATGDEAGARARGERYLARHPDSSYSREIRRALAGGRP